jgi:sugar phosphate isomerase/epimerase
MSYRFATCNEVFQQRPMAEVCRDVAAVGYQGLEIAPFILGPDPAALSREDRGVLRRLMSDAKLDFVGLHWLLAAPEGLHATTRDEAIRRRTWKYVDQFIDLCADLSNGGRTVVVFGSPKQRASRDGLSAEEATDAYIEGLFSAAPHAEERGVTLLIEALSPDQCDVVTSLGEAVAIVKQIGSPAVQTMFDTHNAVAETVPHTELIREFFPYIKHVHVNEMDGKEPGMGDYDFGALMKCLSGLHYEGWVSLEAFDFTRDPIEIISRSIHHLRAAA